MKIMDIILLLCFVSIPAAYFFSPITSRIIKNTVIVMILFEFLALVGRVLVRSQIANGFAQFDRQSSALILALSTVFLFVAGLLFVAFIILLGKAESERQKGVSQEWH